MSTTGLMSNASATNRIILLGAILTLGNLAEIIHKSSRIYLFQQAQCLLHYENVDPSKIHTGFRIDEALCKVNPIQSHLATIDGIDSFLYFLPPLLVLATFQELLSREGLRRLLLLSLLCSGLEVLYTISIFWLHQDWATPAALLSFVFNLIGGGSIVRITIVSKCIADISPPEELTNSYNYISGFYFLASVFGSWIGSLLLSEHVYLLNGLSIACYALTACVSVAIPSHCGREEQEHIYAAITPEQEDDDFNATPPPLAGSAVLSLNPKVPHPLFPKNFFRVPALTVPPKHQPSLFRILVSSWRTSYRSLLGLFTTSFPTSNVLLVYLLNALARGVEVLLPQYTSLLLSWSLATVNSAMALKSLVSALLLLVVPTFRRIYLEPRMGVQQIDLLIMQVSLVANMLGVIALGVSAPAWFFVLSLCVYTCGILLPDSLYSYGTFTLPPGETVAEFYVRLGLVNTVASMFAGPLWSTLFSVVLRSDGLPLGLPFWLCAILFGAGIAGVTALRR